MNPLGTAPTSTQVARSSTDTDTAVSPSRTHSADHATDSSPPSSSAVLSLQAVSKQFGPEDAIDELSLTVSHGELLTLLGPSGCGKTTTLRTIAGLERPDAGTVQIDDTVVADATTFIPPEQRDVGLVFQEFALFPHLTAEENIAFGLQDQSPTARRERVTELFELIGLTDQREAYPEALSGGQKQRVALARALAPNPEVVLLDEPFSNLDRELRIRMREEVRRILKAAEVTAVFVTHNQEEALSISDRLAVVRNGHIEQVGHPETVFQHPTSRFVADFLGDAGFLPGTIREETVVTPLGSLPLTHLRGTTTTYTGEDIEILVRPDDVTARPVSKAAADGVVTYRNYLGPVVQYRIQLFDGVTIECLHNHDTDLDLDTTVAVDFAADHPLAWFPARQ